MGRGTRRAIVALLSLAGLLVVALAILLGSGAGQRRLAALASEAIARRIAGSVSIERLAIGPGGVELLGVRIFPPQEAEPALVAERIAASPALALDLLRARVWLHRLVLVGATVRLESESPDEAPGLVRAFEPAEPAPAEEAQGTPASWEVRVDRLEIEGSSVLLRRGAERPALDLRDLRAELAGRIDPHGAEAAGTLAGALHLPLEGAARVELDLGLTGDFRRVEVRRLEATFRRSSLAVRGAGDLQRVAAGIDALRLRIDPADARTVVADWLPTSPIVVEGSGDFGHGVATAELLLVQEREEGEAGRLRIEASADPAAQRWTLRLDGNALDPHALDERAPSGRLAIRAELAGIGSAEASGTIEIPSLLLGSGRAGPLRAVFVLRDERLAIDGFEARLPGGQLFASGRLSRSRIALDYQLQADDLQRLRAAVLGLVAGAGLEPPVLPALAGELRLRGRMGGRPDAPDLEAELRSAAFTLGDVGWSQVAGSVDVRGLWTEPRGLVSLRAARIGSEAGRVEGVEADLHLGGDRARGVVSGRTPAGILRADLDVAASRNWKRLRFDRLDLRWPRGGLGLRRPFLLSLEEGVRIEGLSLEMAGGGRLDAQGSLVGDRLALSLDAHRLDLASVPPARTPEALGLRGRLDATARVEGSLRRPAGEIRIDLREGAVAGFDGIRLAGGMWLERDRLESRLEGFRGEVALTARAAIPWPIDRRREIEGEARLAGVDLAEIARLLGVRQELAGRAEAELRLAGTLATPRGELVLRGADLAVAGRSGIGATLRARVDEAIGIEAELRQREASLHATGRFAVPPGRLVDDPAEILRAPLEATIEGRSFALSDLAPPMRGWLDLQATLAGSIGKPRGTAIVALREGGGDGIARLDATLTLVAEEETTRLEVESELRQRPLLGGAIFLAAPIERIAEPERLGAIRIFGELASRDLDPGPLARALGLRQRIRGSLDGSLRVDGTLADPRFEIEARGADLVVGRVPWGDLAVQARYLDRQLAGEVGFLATAGGSAALRGAMAIDLGLPALLGRRNREAERPSFEIYAAADDLDLQFLEGLSPDLRQSEGKLDASIEWRTVAESPLPRLEGMVQLREGRFGYTGFGDVRQVALDLELQPEAIRLRRLSARSGGTLTATGAALRSGGAGSWDLDLSIEADRFAVITDDLTRGWLDARARLTGTATDEGLDARLSIQRAALELADTPTKEIQSLQPHPHFVVVRGDFGAARARAQPRPSEPSAWPILVEIATERPIAVEGTDVNLSATCDLRLVLRGGAPQLVGMVQVREGQVLVLSRRFTLTRGRVTYTGAEPPGDPRLDVEARHESPHAVVTVAVSGTAQRPILHMRSNPPMSEAEIATLLATGRPQARAGAGGASGASGAGDAASALGAVIASQLRSGIASRLPVDVISFEGGTEGAFEGSRLEAGTYVSDRIYVGYARRFEGQQVDEERNNVNEVRIEYLLTPRWTLEVTYGDAAVGGVDLVWRKDF